MAFWDGKGGSLAKYRIMDGGWMSKVPIGPMDLVCRNLFVLDGIISASY